MKDIENIEKEVFLAQWLEGKLSDKDLQLLVSEEEFHTYLKLRKGIEVFDSLNSKKEDSFAKLKKNTLDKKSKIIKFPAWTYTVAASAVIILGIFFLTSNNDTVYQTGFGQQEIYTLLDGSEVILNSKSQIEFKESDWDINRNILLTGEAFFKVKKGTTFTVTTKNGTVEVLGTQFNVNSNDDYFEVACVEGKVKVDNGEVYYLTQNQSVRKINGFKTEAKEEAIYQNTWMRGESSFESVPLKYVIISLENQYSVSFNDNHIDTSMRFTGSFTHNDMVTALTTVFKPMGISYKIESKNVIELSNN